MSDTVALLSCCATLVIVVVYRYCSQVGLLVASFPQSFHSIFWYHANWCSGRSQHDLGFVAFHWSMAGLPETTLEKTEAPLPVATSHDNKSWSRGGASCPPPLPIVGINLAWAHLCSEFICAAALLSKMRFYPVVIHCFWFFRFFHSLFCTDIWALGGGNVVCLSHVRLSISVSYSLHLGPLWVCASPCLLQIKTSQNKVERYINIWI